MISYCLSFIVLCIIYIFKFFTKAYNSNKLIIGGLDKQIEPLKCSIQMLTKNDYFNILKNIDKYVINNNVAGIEYMLSIDTETGKMSVLSDELDKNQMILKSFSNTNIFILTAVKQRHVEKIFIRNAIVITGNVQKYISVEKMNDANKMFGDSLSLNYITYNQLTTKKYKTQILKHYKNIKNDVDFIEFFNIDTPSKIYQWSPKQMPITFYCRTCPKHYEKLFDNQTSKFMYILFLTINADDMISTGIKPLPFHTELFGNINGPEYPIQFSPSTCPNAYIFNSNVADLNNQYVSLAYDIKNREWHFIQKMEKSDTYSYGDNFKNTELNTWASYNNPVLKSDLLIDISKIPDQMYFVSTKDKKHEAPIKFNNFVKNSLITTYVKPGSNIIDLASGRASDLFSYRKISLNDLLFIEFDKDAIDTAVNRKYMISNPNKNPLKIMNANLNDKDKDNITKINDYINWKASSIYCFFALHYLTDTVARIKNISSLISMSLEEGGHFIYTAFDGPKVIKLLDANKGKWEIMENGSKKYSIVAKYKQSDITTAKRSIKLILPFNVNTYYYDENLINDEILDKEFKSNGLKLLKTYNFMDFIEEFKKSKSFFYNEMTDADRIFSGLYQCKIYVKI